MIFPRRQNSHCCSASRSSPVPYTRGCRCSPKPSSACAMVRMRKNKIDRTHTKACGSADRLMTCLRVQRYAIFIMITFSCNTPGRAPSWTAISCGYYVAFALHSGRNTSVSNTLCALKLILLSEVVRVRSHTIRNT